MWAWLHRSALAHAARLVSAGHRCTQSTPMLDLPWSLAWDVSDTLTASWLLNELTPIMPVCAGVLPRVGIWLWFRGTLYNASAMSAARLRMIS